MKPSWWNNNYTVLMITWMGWISIYLARSVLPPVLPVLTTELGLTHTQSGLLETAYLIGYIISKLPAGTLSEKYGPRKVLAASMIGYGASTFLVAYAQGFIHIFTLRFLVGLFQGVHLPVANALLSDRFGDKQSRAIGFNESGANVGNTLAFPVAVSILSVWGWRTAFMVLSLPAFLLSIATLALMSDEVAVTEKTEKEEGVLRDYLWVLVPYALSHATYNLVLRTTFTFTPSFLVEFKGMTVAAAGFMSMVLPAAGIFAKMSSGLIVERTGPRNAICGASALSAVFLLSLVVFPGTEILALNLLVLGLTLYSFSPIIYSSTTSSLPSGLKAMGLGLVTMFGNTVGAVSTSVVGALIDARGYEFTFYAIAVTTLLASGLIFGVMSKK
ncbi:MAG: MFS transporter [Candidatus Bathyarchaeota archaeon]|nr:MFS transporter [Candidatus Bathyarchaeota archaeon]